MYYDSTINQPRICSNVSGLYGWIPLSGLWTLNGVSPNQYIYPNSPSYNVGIGTTDPNGAKLTVLGDANTTNGAIMIRRTDLGGPYSHALYGNTGNWYLRSSLSNGTIVMQDTGGKVGIGTANPQTTLDVVGGIKLGNSNSSCNTTTAGSMRYDNVNNVMQFCNSTSWVDLSPSNNDFITGLTCGTTYQNPYTRKLVVMARHYAYDSSSNLPQSIYGVISPNSFANNQGGNICSGTLPLGAFFGQLMTTEDNGWHRRSITFVVPAGWYYQYVVGACNGSTFENHCTTGGAYASEM